MYHKAIAHKVAQRWLFAGPLTDVSKLRYQAVFLVGAAGSGKTYVSHRWLKYMPGGGSAGVVDRSVWETRLTEQMSEEERNLSNIQFNKVLSKIQAMGIEVELVDPQHARIPFRLYTYDHKGKARLIHPSEWEEILPPAIYNKVENLQGIVFGTPIHELPSYWRQVNPDLYKEEITGYMEKEPGYVHQMSSDMSKSYFEGVLDSGDPLFVDGTGRNLRKMTAWIKAAKAAGYRTSLVFVYVPLTVNQIRNVTRPRNVAADEVTRQWRIIKSNFAALRSLVDKSHFVDNRNPPADRANWNKNKDKINAFIRKSTSGQYSDLLSLIREEAPQELDHYGALLSS